MTAQVFDNAMTAHVWAQQRQTSGRSHNGNFYFEGRRIYSYGSHFVAGLALPDGNFAVNDSGYSMTTKCKHMPAVRRALNYTYLSFPNLTAIADALESIAAHKVDKRGHSAHHTQTLEHYLRKHWRELDDNAGAYAYRLISRGSWQAHKARLAKAAETEAKRAQAATDRLYRAQAAELARVPLALVRERSWKQADSYGQRDLRNTTKQWAAYHKAAGGKRIKAAVWARLKLARSIVKLAERHQDRYGSRRKLVGVRAAISTLRRCRMADYNLPEPIAAARSIKALEMLLESARYLERNARLTPATRDKLERLAAYAADGVRFIEGERAAEARKRRDREQLRQFARSIRSYVAALREGTKPDRAAWWYRFGGQIEAFGETGRFPVVAAKLAAQLPAIKAAGDALATVEERKAAEVLERRAKWLALPPEGRRAAWRAGESVMPLEYSDTAETGPLLRAVGAVVEGCRVKEGELQTSEGARVPLRHAFAVFAFVRDCRAKGLPWLPASEGRNSHARHGPAQIRVGHFQVDSITAEGDFKAGCHSIRWPEVERLAKGLGVFDCETISEGADA